MKQNNLKFFIFLARKTPHVLIHFLLKKIITVREFSLNRYIEAEFKPMLGFFFSLRVWKVRQGKSKSPELARAYPALTTIKTATGTFRTIWL